MTGNKNPDGSPIFNPNAEAFHRLNEECRKLKRERDEAIHWLQHARWEDGEDDIVDAFVDRIRYPDGRRG